MTAELGLAEAIAQLRREIGTAVRSAEDEPLQFRLGPVELELQVALANKAGIKGEAKWVVVSFGGEVAAEQTWTHKVRLSLEPVFQGEDEVLVSDETDRPG